MKIIVGVTTTKARLGLFFDALQSLQKQKCDNFCIFINISTESYLNDDGIDEVPGWMAGEVVQVNFVKNLGPYRKLIPLIEQIGEEDVIVTADDDVLYSEDWLKKIVKTTLLYPNAIVCGMARHIKKNIVGRYQNYANWPLVVRKGLATGVIPIGCAGIAYKKELIDLEFLSNRAFFECAPTADDIWFRLASIRKNTKVYVDPAIGNGNFYIKHPFGLEQLNLYKPYKSFQFHNRLIIKLKTEIMNYFGIPLSKNDFSWRAAWKYLNSHVVKL